MSIINEALKKTQFQLEQKISGAISASPRPSSKNTWLKVTAILIFLGFLANGGIFAFLVLRNHSTTIRLTQNKPTPVAHTQHQGTVTLFSHPPAASVQTSAQKNSQPDSPALILNGIITMDEEKLALINNQIIKEGDYLDGKRVLSISMDEVELFDKGEIIVLKNKR